MRTRLAGLWGLHRFAHHRSRSATRRRPAQPWARTVGGGGKLTGAGEGGRYLRCLRYFSPPLPPLCSLLKMVRRMSFPGGWEGATRSVWRRLRLEQAKRSHRLPTLTTHTGQSWQQNRQRPAEDRTSPIHGEPLGVWALWVSQAPRQ